MTFWYYDIMMGLPEDAERSQAQRFEKNFMSYWIAFTHCPYAIALPYSRGGRSVAQHNIKCQIIFGGNCKAGSWQKKSSCKPLASQHSEKVNFEYSYRGARATRAVHASMGVHVGVSPQKNVRFHLARSANEAIYKLYGSFAIRKIFWSNGPARLGAIAPKTMHVWSNRAFEPWAKIARESNIFLTSYVSPQRDGRTHSICNIRMRRGSKTQDGSLRGLGEALGASARDLRKCASQGVYGTVAGNKKMRLFNICDPPKTSIPLQRGAHSD